MYVSPEQNDREDREKVLLFQQLKDQVGHSDPNQNIIKFLLNKL